MFLIIFITFFQISMTNFQQYYCKDSLQFQNFSRYFRNNFVSQVFPKLFLTVSVDFSPQPTKSYHNFFLNFPQNYVFVISF